MPSIKAFLFFMPAPRHHPPPGLCPLPDSSTPPKLEDKMTEVVMGGKCFEIDSNHVFRKRWRGGVDMISLLPDDVIANILSFLSLKEAATTSFVSSRWSDFWKHTPNFIFENKSYTEQMAELRGLGYEYHEWATSVLNSHEASPLKEFKISFVINESSQYAVTKWSGPGNARQVVRLELNFRMPIGNNGANLEEVLREISCDFNSLKDLCLKNFGVSNEAINLILHKCPLLERLTIQASVSVKDAERSTPRYLHDCILQQTERFSHRVFEIPHSHLQVFGDWGFKDGNVYAPKKVTFLRNQLVLT